MKINIIAIGKCKKNSPEYAIIEEYVKRSSWQINIKEKDNSNQAYISIIVSTALLCNAGFSPGIIVKSFICFFTFLSLYYF